MLRLILRPNRLRKSSRVKRNLKTLRTLRKVFSDSAETADGRLAALWKYRDCVEEIPSAEQLSGAVIEELDGERRQFEQFAWDSLTSDSVHFSHEACVAIHRARVAFNRILFPEEWEAQDADEVLCLESAPAVLEGVTIKRAEIQRQNRQIVLGDLETIRRLGVDYTREDESIGGNAGPNHAAYNMYIDPATGAIRAVGNYQHVGERIRSSLQPITLRVHVFPDDPASQEEYIQGSPAILAMYPYVHEIYLSGRRPMSPEVRAVLCDLLGKKFRLCQADNHPLPNDDPADTR